MSKVPQRWPDPFFIVGSGRCGTKLLRRMLLKNSSLRIPIETHFLPKLHDKFGTEPVLLEDYLRIIENHHSSKGTRWVDTIAQTEGMSYQSVRSELKTYCKAEQISEATIAEFTELLYSALYAPQVDYIGDKTPHYGVEIPLLRELWPDAKFIHLVRDGVYTADSMTRHPGFVKLLNAELPIDQLDRCSYGGEVAKFSSAPVTVETAADLWKRVVAATRTNGKELPDSAYLEIKYETLLLHPLHAIQRVGKFLGLDNSNYWQQRASGVPKPFYLQEIRERFTEAEYQEIAERIRPTLQSFDYPDTRTYSTNRERLRSVNYYLQMIADGGWIKNWGRKILQ